MVAKREILKRGDHFVLWNDNSVRIDGVRFSYPHIGTPYKGKTVSTAPGKHSVVAMLPKPTHRDAARLLKTMSDELLIANKEDPNLYEGNDRFLRDGDKNKKNLSYRNHWTVSASEVKMPDARGPDKRKLTPDEADRMFFGGSWGAILIRPWYQNNEFGKKVNANLIAIQFGWPDTAFGEGRLGDEEIEGSFEYQGGSGAGSDFDDDLGGRSFAKVDLSDI